MLGMYKMVEKRMSNMINFGKIDLNLKKKFTILYSAFSDFLISKIKLIPINTNVSMFKTLLSFRGV